MSPALSYAFLTARHKWYVLRAGRRLRAPLWRLIVHDLSKFGRWELRAYGRQFFGEKNDPLGFTIAWCHHQNHNPHHWEWWIPRTGHNRGGFQDNAPLPMPLPYIREMVADWLGASRAYEGRWPPSQEDWPWLQQNLAKITPRMHPITRVMLNAVLKEYFARRPL